MKKQKSLIAAYKNKKESGYIYLCFGERGESYRIDSETVNQIFNLVNNNLMKLITEKETEFSQL